MRGQPCQMCAGLDLDGVAAALTMARRRGGAWAEVFYEHRDSRTVRFGAAGIDVRSDCDLGASVRVGGAGAEGRGATNVVTSNGLLDAVEAATAAGGGRSTSGGPGVDLVEVTVAAANRPQRDLDSGDVATRADLVQRAATGAREASAAVRSVTVTLVEVAQHVLVATDDGTLRRDRRHRTRLTCRVVARDQGVTAAGFEGVGNGGGLELFDDRSPEAIGAAAAGRATA